MLDTCILNRKPPPLIDLVSIKTQAKRKISPAGVALSMVPILGTSSQIAISTSVKESNMANEKCKIAKIKGRKHRTFQHLRFKCISLSNRVAAVRLPISKERVHLVRMHQARTRYIILHYKMVSFLRCQIMFMSNSETQWSGPTPALPPSLTHWRYGTAGLSGKNKNPLTTHFEQLNIHHVWMFHFISC